jgi:hypothetical protein
VAQYGALKSVSGRHAGNGRFRPVNKWPDLKCPPRPLGAEPEEQALDRFARTFLEGVGAQVSCFRVGDVFSAASMEGFSTRTPPIGGHARSDDIRRGLSDVALTQDSWIHAY